LIARPVSVTLVNLPVDAVVAPIAVELIPVAVVLKWPDVMVKSLAPVFIDEAPKPDKAKAPEVPVRLIAPVVNVKPLLAVNVCVDVKAPVFVVVTPVAPIVMAEVLVVPMVITPFVEVPVPAVKTRFPPVDVVPELLPPFNVNVAPVPEFVVLFPGWKTKAVGVVPAAVVTSAVCPPAKVRTPADETLMFEEVRVKAFAPSVQVEGAAPVKFNAPEELSVTTPVPDPIFDVPVEVRVVNLPVEGVSVPIAVELIPVAVVLKLLEVIVKALEPVFIDEAPRPDNANAPEVPVKLIAPPERVSPLLAVKRPADVIVPVLVVEILPVVEIVMFAARSLPVTEANVGRPEAFPCSTVVVVPASVPKRPADVLVTTPFVVNPPSVIEVFPVRAVKVPAAGVPPPIVPGAAKVAPLSDDAFKFATFVVEETTKGAVPVEIVE
jgi:hypothetical protein